VGSQAPRKAFKQLAKWRSTEVAVAPLFLSLEEVLEIRCQQLARYGGPPEYRYAVTLR